MCGIAGAVDLRGSRTFPPTTLLAMCRALAHRGPDDEGFYRRPGIALGARRLAIVDLAGGGQPLSNEDGSVWVAFNGELFDHPTLLNELRARGHRLTTRCDTEVWVHLYEELGETIFEHVKGQFAVSLWDVNDRTLRLGRDRFGITPLYYTQADGWLLWSSEIKGLLASGMVAATPDARGVSNMFCLHAAAAERTCFEGIKAIPPGHFLEVRKGRVRLKRYWQLDFPDAGDELRVSDPRPMVDELEALLRQSVRRRLRGDVPVATYLSGGVDSTLVTALAAQESGAPVRAYTIGLEGAGKDESGQAAESARHIGCDLVTRRIDRRAIADTYTRLVRAAELPVVDTSSACFIRLAEDVREDGYRVVLSGEGADEALAGYPFYQWQKLQAFGGNQLARVLHRVNEGGLLVLDDDGARRREPFRAFGGARTTRQRVYELLGRTRESLFSTHMWDLLRGHSPFQDLRLTNDRLSRWHPLNQSLYMDYCGQLQGGLVSIRADRAAMNASVEARPPFLDEDVVSFCARLHPSYKLRGMREKWVLRRVAERVLPRRVAWRRKHGFLTSFAKSFLQTDRPEWVDELLSPESLRATPYFDPDAVARERRRQERGRWSVLTAIAFEVNLATVVATQLWHHTFCGGGLARLPTWTPPVIEPEAAAGVAD